MSVLNFKTLAFFIAKATSPAYWLTNCFGLSLCIDHFTFVILTNGGTYKKKTPLCGVWIKQSMLKIMINYTQKIHINLYVKTFMCLIVACYIILNNLMLQLY